jgi:outer membrane receptor for Fe3+-dicitrate
MIAWLKWGVTAQVSTETPTSVVSLGPQQISQQPGMNLDDRLRQIPGFSPFRRTSSVLRNPTIQGVSLRGIGSTGAIRTLVLWDGVPLNDPFGGWIYWDEWIRTSSIVSKLCKGRWNGAIR